MRLPIAAGRISSVPPPPSGLTRDDDRDLLLGILADIASRRCGDAK
jgi:hypothetical protein